ncbi:MAG TPA: class II D-tagatose-bisphosphate aldolase, non-catalytic subunit [Micromonosporaceae bacterium]
MTDDALVKAVDASLPVAVGMATRYCLTAASEVAAETGRPVMVVASRRQVDTVAGSGYLGWSTGQWCAARRHPPGAEALGRVGHNVLLARDHAGPYQHPDDLADGGVPLTTAMATTIEALRRDIESGVDLIHIDTSLGSGGRPERPAIARQRAIDLVEHCVRVAARHRRRVGFEVGVETQVDQIDDPMAYLADLVPLLRDLRRVCDVAPLFVVARTGTRVSGLGNSGVLALRPDSRTARLQLGLLGTLVQATGSRLKAHGCDFLPVPAIRSLRDAGAWMNVSSELGAVQTTAVLRAARSVGLDAAADAFCDEAVRAGCWREPGNRDSVVLSDDEKVALGGASLFAGATFADLRDRLDAALASRGGSTARLAIDAAKQVISRYLDVGGVRRAAPPRPAHRM